MEIRFGAKASAPSEKKHPYLRKKGQSKVGKKKIGTEKPKEVSTSLNECSKKF